MKRCLQPVAVLVTLTASAAVLSASQGNIHIPAGTTVSFPWVRTDALGFRWDIAGNGGIADGTNDAYDGGMQLRVNTASFPSYGSARLSKDGSEIEIGPWRQGSVAVSRRIRINRQAGYCRWIDIFENTGAEKVTLAVLYYFDMGEATSNTRTTSGKAQLSGKDWGIVTAGAPGSPRPAVVHVFAMASAKLKPRLEFRPHSDDLHYRIRLTIPPRRAVALCFFEAQRRPFARAAEFLQNFKPTRELRGVPPELRRILLNMPGIPLLAGSVELDRSQEADLIVPVSGGRLRGRIANRRFVLKTEFGEVNLAAAELIGLARPSGSTERLLAVLTDGQVVAGELVSGPIVLHMGSGNELKVSPADLRQLSFRISPERPEEIPQTRAMVVLRGGARLAFDHQGLTFKFLTAHGEVHLPANELRAIELDTPNGGLHRAIFQNGSVLSGLLADPRVKLRLSMKLPMDVPRQRVRRFIMPPREEDHQRHDRLTLRNGDVLLGQLADPSWTVQTKLGKVVARIGEVAKAEFSAVSPGQVKLTLRDGTRISGQFGTERIGFHAAPAVNLHIHVSHIASVTGPAKNSPTSPDR
ncbi:MAG: hypothetical protein B1H04_02805 [Planctomycetales bacterium 4484_123]|nr:MAG: hypothetical protein B1H04_02805 [Planctomycetales bacterium 4484_123]